MQDVFILSLIQGITEFLPLSSTGHVILLSQLLHIPSLGRLTEISLHFGTLLVIFVYFWRDLVTMIEGLFFALKGKFLPGLWLVLFLCAATIPAAIAGYMLHKYGGGFGRTMPVIGWVSIISGIALYLVDQECSATKALSHLKLHDAILIGLLQVVAFIPGASRSGMTIIGGRLRGLKRAESVRFSFLLSIPTVLGAVTLTFLELVEIQQVSYSPDLFIAIGLSFSTGLGILFLMMWWIRKFTFTLFAIYRVIFGVFILWYF